MTILTAPSIPFSGDYAVDPDHSSVGFAVRHMGVSTFRGSFTDIRAEVSAGADGALAISGEVPVAGISVRSPIDLRTHLLGDDFFAADEHPSILFTADRAVPQPDGTITARGRLTMRNVTRDVVATGTWTPPVEDPFGGVRAAIELETTIDRRDFGMTWNMPLPKGGDALGARVTITAHLELLAR